MYVYFRVKPSITTQLYRFLDLNTSRCPKITKITQDIPNSEEKLQKMPYFKKKDPKNHQFIQFKAPCPSPSNNRVIPPPEMT